MRNDAGVVDLDTLTDKPSVTLHTGEKVYADVIVSADGMRPLVLQKVIAEFVFGLQAFGLTFETSYLANLHHPFQPATSRTEAPSRELISRPSMTPSSTS